ncbi:MAG: hypothetical protein A2166_06700 [Omnitrophica WOR_2 bacterium RBG_13_41_10]|nr:MAG: hypothetical protein A2166_06700 [Omnitrophica WOR_2 bacterium RBG_13_41_10]
MIDKEENRLILFLDESGDHSLTKIDPQYPMFVLAGCLFESGYYEKTVIQEISIFKKELFGHSKIILHTDDITRNKRGFEKIKEADFRHNFYRKLNALLNKLAFKIIACAIRKDDHFEKYGLAAVDPYMLSLDCLVERFVFELEAVGKQGIIIAESRNSILDNQLELAFLNLKVQGTNYVSAARVKKSIAQLLIKEKKENIAGLQIADLIASPIGRKVLGKKNQIDYEAIEKRYRSKGGRYLGFGLVILPKK